MIPNWTRYEDSEPMMGRLRGGTIWHAVQQSDLTENACTRRTLCGAGRSSVMSRSLVRRFDPSAAHACERCAKALVSLDTEDS